MCCERSEPVDRVVGDASQIADIDRQNVVDWSERAKSSAGRQFSRQNGDRAPIADGLAEPPTRRKLEYVPFPHGVTHSAGDRGSSTVDRYPAARLRRCRPQASPRFGPHGTDRADYIERCHAS